MIKRDLYIKHYDWQVDIYYAVTTYWTDIIMRNLARIHCPRRLLAEAYESLSAGAFNSGLTYSNFDLRRTVMVIALTTSADQFVNSLAHEKRHLEDHMWQALGIEPKGEEIAYLSGDIAQQLTPDIEYFICDCEKFQRRESKSAATRRAKRLGFPASNVTKAKGDGYYIAPRGLKTSRAKHAYADIRSKGASKAKAARIAHSIDH